MADDLDRLRAEIRATDRQILALVARRLRAARRIGAVKQRRGLPLRNFDVEAEVIREARQLCRKFKIDQSLGEDLMRKLIEAAIQAQDRDGRRKP